MTLISTIRACLPHIIPSHSYNELYTGIIFKTEFIGDFNALMGNLMSVTPAYLGMRDILLAHYLVKELGWRNATAIKYCLDTMPAINYMP